MHKLGFPWTKSQASTELPCTVIKISIPLVGAGPFPPGTFLVAGKLPDSTSAFRATRGKRELQLPLMQRFWASEKQEERMVSLQNSLPKADAFKANFICSKLGLAQSTFHFFFGTAVGSRIHSPSIGCSRLSSLLMGKKPKMDHLRALGLGWQSFAFEPGLQTEDARVVAAVQQKLGRRCAGICYPAHQAPTTFLRASARQTL